MNLSNLKIGSRLYIAFGLIVVLLALLVTLAEISFNPAKRGQSPQHSYL